MTKKVQVSEKYFNSLSQIEKNFMHQSAPKWGVMYCKKIIKFARLLATHLELEIQEIDGLFVIFPDNEVYIFKGEDSAAWAETKKDVMIAFIKKPTK